jgi:hypothetical protein
MGRRWTHRRWLRVDWGSKGRWFKSSRPDWPRDRLGRDPEGFLVKPQSSACRMAVPAVVPEIVTTSAEKEALPRSALISPVLEYWERAEEPRKCLPWPGRHMRVHPTNPGKIRVSEKEGSSTEIPSVTSETCAPSSQRSRSLQSAIPLFARESRSSGSPNRLSS